MGDMTKFNSAIEYYIFNVLLICLLISEIFIFFYTRSKLQITLKRNASSATAERLFHF